MEFLMEFESCHPAIPNVKIAKLRLTPNDIKYRSGFVTESDGSRGH
jgi:hypothetical protein